jgi:hypothetical protein
MEEKIGYQACGPKQIFENCTSEVKKKKEQFTRELERVSD